MSGALETIWEILTFGRLPYEGKDGNQVVLLLESGQQLKQPATCSVDLYFLLQQCKQFSTVKFVYNVQYQYMGYTVVVGSSYRNCCKKNSFVQYTLGVFSIKFMHYLAKSPD